MQGQRAYSLQERNVYEHPPLPKKAVSCLFEMGLGMRLEDVHFFLGFNMILAPDILPVLQAEQCFGPSATSSALMVSSLWTLEFLGVFKDYNSHANCFAKCSVILHWLVVLWGIIR